MQAATHVSVCPLPMVEHSDKQKVRFLIWRIKTRRWLRQKSSLPHSTASLPAGRRSNVTPLLSPLFPLPFLQGDFNLREGGPSIYGSLLRRYIAIYEVFPNQVNHSAVHMYTAIATASGPCCPISRPQLTMVAAAPACCASAQKHPPVVDLSNFEERKEEITQQLMDAATNSGGFPLCRKSEQL